MNKTIAGKLLALLLCMPLLFSCSGDRMDQEKESLVCEATMRPWAYWWWMGNSVTKEGIRTNLEAYHQAGIGGLHIVPIYGEKGDEDNFIRFLSPEFMEMLVYTIGEADRLGMKIDMTSGTGWPFGGPGITRETSAKAMKLVRLGTNDLPGLEEAVSSVKEGHLVMLVRVKDGDVEKVGLETGEGGAATMPEYGEDVSLIAMVEYPTLQKVKRAAPGGEGLVVDFFDRECLEGYMHRFDSAFSSTDFRSARLRAFYNDSYEVYGANYTDDFLRAFKERRGYDLWKEFPVLLEEGPSEMKERVICDYGETIADLLYSELTLPWVDICNRMGSYTRNQAHGSPGNILDLYAAADIPETESFGASEFDIPGVRQDPDYNPDHFGRPDPLVMKFASSASNISGKPLTASESTTWLGDHFKVALSQIKPQLDEMFVSGINHVFFHGITYNPPEKEFPGRLFYASTNYGTHSHFFEELPALTGYIENCQRILQQSAPDNDVLLYFPMHDVWSTRYDEQYLVPMKVHNPDNWLESTDCGKLAEELWDSGFSFDYVSDRMLAGADVRDGYVVLPGGEYRAVVIPECKYISDRTVKVLDKLVSAGVTVIFHNRMPEKASGYYRYEAREKDMKRRLERMSGKCIVDSDVAEALEACGARRECFPDKGLSFIRKKMDGRTVYFVANQSDVFHDGWIGLSSAASQVEIYDPMRGIRGSAFSGGDGGTVRLQLEPGQSCFMICHSEAQDIPAWKYVSVDENNAVELSGKWELTPVAGAPKLPSPVHLKELCSWTDLGGDYLYFSGAGSYSLDFELPEQYAGKAMLLDLGDVRETASVKINGRDLGLLWCIPYRTLVPEGVLGRDNRIEIRVKNLSFNRVIDLDRRGVNWKNYYEINFVDINYKKYDASDKEPVLSGLLGPVRLLPAVIEN